ncbi:MAG: hypothetical protein LBJ95_00470 [Oscillospiraceae bacterium]|nr:hypothetical protein [Oscillospiraceae bacterium]
MLLRIEGICSGLLLLSLKNLAIIFKSPFIDYQNRVYKFADPFVNIMLAYRPALAAAAVSEPEGARSPVGEAVEAAP